MRTKLYTLICFLLAATFAFPQTVELDSLKDALEKATSKDEQIRLNLEIAALSKKKDRALEYYSQALNLSQGQNAELRAKANKGMAQFYYKSKEFQLAIDYKKKEVELWRETNKRPELATALQSLGTYQRKAYFLTDAILSYDEAEELFSDLENFEKQVDCLNRIGVIYKDLENYAEALPYYHKAFEVAKDHNLPARMSSACINIGVVLKKQENYDEALEYYYSAEEISLEIEDYHSLANVYNNIGNVLRIQKRHKDALRYYRLAVTNRKKSGNLSQLGYTYNNMGLVYKNLGNWKQAISYLLKSERTKKEAGDEETLASTYLNFSEVYLEKGDLENYVRFALKAEEYATRFNQYHTLRNIRINNGKYEAAKGNYEKAYYYMSHVFDEMDTLDEKSQRVLTTVLQAQFRDRQNRSTISELSLANDQLDTQKKELERKEQTSRMLIWALSIVSIILIATTVFIFVRQKAYATQSKELLSINNQLHQTMISKEEKETLLKEVHHRVKNNLQIIKSLIRLQSSGVDDQNAQTMLMDFEQRVSSMALVHESLYKSGDLAKVNVTEYYTDLINDLIIAYNMKQDLKTELSVEVGELGIDILVPLGLLTNEIISNSLKHAFNGRDDGKIVVQLRELDDRCHELFIGDNGLGFDFDSEREKNQTLGLELIVALTEQLDADFEFINENGSYFRVKFKCS